MLCFSSFVDDVIFHAMGVKHAIYYCLVLHLFLIIHRSGNRHSGLIVVSCNAVNMNQVVYLRITVCHVPKTAANYECDMQ